MATILYIGTHGTDDPTRASFPFFLARGAVEAGHQPAITLMMDAVVLIKDSIAQNIQGVGIPPLKDLVAHAVAHKVPITVWRAWASARGVTDQDLVGKNAKFGTPVDAANMVAEYDKVLTF